MKNSLLSIPALYCALLLSLPFPVLSQETRGMIFGRITDPQSRAVPDAEVTVTNVRTGVAVRLAANSTGYYEANLLLPGEYEVAVDAAGFKKAIRSGIILPVSSRVEAAIQLEIGTIAETISVTAQSALVDSNTASSGRVVDSRSVADLPVLNNSPLLLARLTPGVQTGGINARYGLHSVTATGGYDAYVAGNVGGNEWSVDGVPNAGWKRRPAYMPSSDTIQEFKVETSSFDASVGHNSGVLVSMISKAGTNELHGSLTEQHWQQRWHGTPFFTKQLYYRSIAEAETRGDTAAANYLRSQDKQPAGRLNYFAGSLGGPVVIPKVYDGRNRLFFFASFTGVISGRTEPQDQINYTVPTAENRAGDFSQLLNVNASYYQIHDPLSVRPDPARPGHYVRDPIPGNVLPTSRILNPVYNSYVKLLPQPNSNPLDPKAEPTLNYRAVGTPNIYHYYAIDQRTDYQRSERNRFFAKWYWTDFFADIGDWTYESARTLHSVGQMRSGRGAAFDWVYVHSAATLLDVVIAGNYYEEGYTPPELIRSFTPSSVGLPSYLDVKAGDKHQLPSISVDGYRLIGYP